MAISSLINISILLSIALNFTACINGNLINIEEYKTVKLEKSNFFPSIEELERKSRIRVIIQDFTSNNLENAKKFQLGNFLALDLKEVLSKDKNVRVLEHISKDTDIKEAIRLSNNNKNIHVNLAQADYLIKGEIHTATYEHIFQESTSYTDKERKVYNHPAFMKDKACIEGTIKILSLPNLKETKSITFDECTRSHEDAKDIRANHGQLLKNACEEGIDSTIYMFKKIFTPKAYIKAMRKDEKNQTIIKVSMGRKQGIKDKDKVEIFKMTDEGSVKIGTGEVSSNITDNYAWIIIKHIDYQETIKEGNYIKVLGREKRFHHFSRMLNIQNIFGSGDSLSGTGGFRNKISKIKIKPINFHYHKAITENELKNLKNILTFVLFPNNISSQNHQDTPISKRYKKVLELIQELPILKSTEKNLEAESNKHQFILLKKENNNKKITIETYDYQLSDQILNFFKINFQKLPFENEGPFFITVSRNIFDNQDTSFKFLYINLHEFNNSAINQVIESYKERLKAEGISSFDFIEQLKHHILSMVTNANAHIKIIKSAVAGEID